MSPPLLATKLYRPPPHPKGMLRPHLIERLNAGLHRNLTLLAAPAGFGKTTLLSQWLDGCARPVAWLTLDASDPISGFTQLVEEVLQHFSAQYGTTVTLSVDIEAKRKDGFDLKTVRIVRENATSLKFKTADFEDE